jgi:hydroxymethylbilane synthase
MWRAEIRGNVDTRIEKVQRGEYDAAILAVAGLERLGRLNEATQLFEATAFLPSPGQGVIAIECRADDDATRALLASLDHFPTRAAAEAERGVLAALGTGCNLPVGAYARLDDGLLALRAFVGAEDGGTPVFGDATGPLHDAEALGRGLGTQLRALAEGAAGAGS